MKDPIPPFASRLPRDTPLGRMLLSVKLSHVFVLVGFLVVATAAALAAFFVTSLYNKEVGSIRNRLEIPAQSMMHVVGQIGANADLALRDVQAAVLGGGGLPQAGPALRQLLLDRAYGRAAARKIEIYDTTGNAIVSTLADPPIPVSVAPFDFFRRQIAARTDRLIVSELVADPIDGKPKIIESRPIIADGGTMRGVVAVYIDADYFQKLFDALPMPAGSSIALFNADGRQLVRTPAVKLGDQILATDFSQRTIYKVFRAASDTGAFGRFTTIVGTDRFIAGVGGAESSFIVTAGWDAPAALASWRSDSTNIIGGAFVGIVIVAALFAYLVAQLQRNEARLLGTIQDIAERKRIELELRHSREDLARAQRVAGIGSFSRDMATGRIEWSDEFLRIWGLTDTTEKTTAEVLALLVHPEDRQKFLEGRDAALHPGSRMPLDFRITRPDGQERVLHREYGVIFDDHKKPIRLFGTVQDITERKKIELEMRRGRENLARAQRVAGVGSFERNLITGEIEFSDELFRIHGVVRGGPQATLEFLHTLVHPEDRERIEEFRRTAGEGTPTPPIDYRIIRPDGVERVLHRECEILFNENGRPLFLFGTLQDVTERKKIELKLQQSRENLARAQQVAGIGSFERDFVTGECEASEEFLRIWGVDSIPLGAAKDVLLPLVHPEDQQRFREMREAALQNKPMPIWDFRIIRPDGAERILHPEFRVVFDNNGTPLRMFGTVQDVTENKKTELEMHRSRESLARAQRIAAIGSFDHDMMTNKAEWSDELYRLYGLSPREDGGDINIALPFVHPEDREKFLSIRDQIAKRIASMSIDFRIIGRDGVERILHRECDIIFDETGKPVRVSGTLQDVTERKRAELEIRRSRENLARAQRIATIGSFERDLITDKVEWSDEIYRILGLEKADTMPTSETLLKLVHPDDRDRFVESRSGELKGQATTPIEYRIVRPDGAERIVRRESAVVFDEKGRPVGRYGTVQDITELRLAERRERELERQLLHSQKLEALGTLASGIAHDLNNALVPIMALSKLMARRFEAGNLIRTNLETIYEASGRARDLVKRVVAFSRKDESEKRDTCIAETVNEALKLLRATIPSSITLEARIGEVPPIPADTTQIHQVVTNLVANASQALGSGIGTITVILDAVPGLSDESEICLSVSDTGIGMDEATQQRIFEPFFTTKVVGEGTGLGLSIVHGIVAGHGGRIEVKSEPGKGTRFDLYFPVPPVAARDEVTSSRPAA